ncbi:putative signal transducing protein [Maribellus mangrovi]|uniref:putative signal transducing protein n=1 Tax=Maribellus mangrovi TaxID=3133146 RepID=UPI0030EBD0EF
MEKGWQEVYMTASEYKAEMAKDILENAGIKCVLMNQHDSAYQSFGDFLIYTAEKDKARSVELLKNLKGE